MGRKCCVPYCSSVNASFKLFPHPTKDRFNRFKKWLAAIKCDSLNSMEPMLVYQTKNVCVNHFSDDSFVGDRAFGKLKNTAVPNTNLPDNTDSGSSESGDTSVKKDLSSSSSEKLLPAEQLSCAYKGLTSSTESSEKEIDVPLHQKEKFAEMLLDSLPSSQDSLRSILSQDIFGEIDDRQNIEPMPTPGPSGTINEMQSDSFTQNQVYPSSPIKVGKRANLLKCVGVRHAKDLTPKAKFLFKQTQQMRRQIRRASSRNLSFRARIKAAEKTLHMGMQKDMESLPAAVSSFLKCQLREFKKSPHGRRFTIEDKVLALSLMKRSGRSYRFLSKYFILPSKRTLLRLLESLSFETGINDDMFSHLAVVVNKQVADLDKYCLIMFDEMSLSAHLDYNASKDEIQGFQDLGAGRRSNVFADKALVFMLRGLRKNYKQPIAFYFTATVKSGDLKRLIKDVSNSVIDAGFHLAATVCDQASANMAAINSLCEDARAECLRSEEEYRGEYFIINGKKIIPLFDPPHLLKGIRNSLLYNDLIFKHKGEHFKASWDHIVQFYEIDKSYSSRVALKLTDGHVIREKIKKMKVANFAQVASHTVGSAMRLVASRSAGSDLDAKAVETAELLLFLDTLFDSINGSAIRPTKFKALRCAIQRKSGHVQFWNEAIRVLDSMKYVSKAGKEFRTPTLRNWSRTLLNLKALWFNLEHKGFQFLSLRNLNQDPLENKFGAIRSYGFRNNMPSCSNFVGAYKSLLLNDMVSSHSIGGNCEEDDCSVLSNLRNYLKSSKATNSEENLETEEGILPLMLLNSDSEDENDVDSPSPTITLNKNLLSRLVVSYTAGYMVKKLYNNCDSCSSLQLSMEATDEHSLIQAKERCRDNERLTYPTSEYTRVYDECRNLTVLLIPKHCHKVGIGKIIKSIVRARTNFSTICCPDHLESYKTSFLNLLVKMLIYNWCESVNRYLSGKDTREIDHMDPIHVKALQYRRLHQRYQK